MTNLFDGYSGIPTSHTATTLTDDTANWVVNQWVGWSICFRNDNLNFTIVSNTATTITWTGDLSGNPTTYDIHFVSRDKLAQIESDAANADLMSEDFLHKKYALANYDISAKVFAYLRSQYRSDFDPLANILNLTSLQQVYCYYVLAKAYQDLSINQDSFESFKGYNMYEKSYNDTIKDALSVLQLDLDQDGVVDNSEILNNNGAMRYLTR